MDRWRPGKPILQGAYVGIKTRSPNMDLLVAIAAVSAWVYSTLSIAVDGPHIYYDVTVAIIVIVSVGSYYESSLKREATERLSDLTSVQVDDARRVSGDGTHEEVALEELAAGDQVLVRTRFERPFVSLQGYVGTNGLSSLRRLFPLRPQLRPHHRVRQELV